MLLRRSAARAAAAARPSAPLNADRHRPLDPAGTALDQDKKTKMAEEVKAEALNLIVKDQSGHEVNFKVKATTKFGKARRSRRAGRGRAARGGGWSKIIIEQARAALELQRARGGARSMRLRAACIHRQPPAQRRRPRRSPGAAVAVDRAAAACLRGISRLPPLPPLLPVSQLLALTSVPRPQTSFSRRSSRPTATSSRWTWAPYALSLTATV